MKLYKKSLLSILSMIFIVVSLFGIHSIFANNNESFKYEAKTISLVPGKDQSQLNITWYGPYNMNDCKVEIAKKSDMVNDIFPVNKAIIFRGTSKNYRNDKYGDFSSNKVVITGLEDNTKYVYRLGNEHFVSDVYNYSTKNPNNFNFIFTADPQIGALNIYNDTKGWKNTLSKAINKFPNTSFIMQAGDQVNTATNEDEYNSVLSPRELTSIPLAPTIGNHDNKINYKLHFNLPNEGYDLTEAGGNYYFVYGNTLFMVLNTNNENTIEHERFMKNAIYKTSGQNIKWKVTMLHHSIYSAASHRDYPSIVNLRNNLYPIFDDLDIDIILMGHDHCYVRTYQMLGNKPQLNQTIDRDKTVINPTGSLYITSNSSSGSKYYPLKRDKEVYSAVRKQNNLPTFLNIEVNNRKIKMTTYVSTYLDKNGSKISNDAILDSYSISK